MALLAKLPGGEAQTMSVGLAQAPQTVSAVLKDSAVGGRKPQENGIKESPLISFVSQRFIRSTMSRRPYEQLWLESHRNYRGLYGPDVMFTATEKSRVFIRVTKTKCNAAYGQLMDVLFANNNFPIAIDPQRLPEGVVDTLSIETNPQTASSGSGDQQSPQQPGQPPSPTQGPPPTKVGFPGDGTRDTEPKLSITADAMVGQLRPNESVQPGPSTSPTAVEIDVAMLSAKKMEKLIQDQLRESNGDKQLRQAAFECVVMGTGCVKGPIAVHVITEGPIDENGKPTQLVTKKPKMEAVSIWNLYPDPDARCVEDLDYLIQRHKLNLSQLRGLKSRAGFRDNEIDLLIAGGFNYNRQWWEPMLQDMPTVQPVEKFEVLEFWGMADSALCKEFGISATDIPKELQELDEIPVNIWVSGNHILRLIFNPFNNGRIPYYMVPYEIQPYTIWGIGVAETMADTQLLMNGFMRLGVDNAVLAGNMVFEVDESALVPGQDYTLYPGKFFRRMGGQQGQAIYPHQFPNTAESNMKMYDKARELADESTFPSYTHGNTGVNPSLGRTSSGLSMMMGAASVGIRMAIKNMDDYLLTPMGQAFFEFNKLNTDDPELKGNFIVSAGGTDSLMRNEVKSQRLISFIQLLENPMLAPFAKWPYLLREGARLMDLDPDKTTNTEQEAQRMALLLQSMQPPPPPQGQPGPGGPKPHQQNQKGSPTNPAENHTPGQTSMPGQKAFSAAKSNGPAQHAPAGQGVS